MEQRKWLPSDTRNRLTDLMKSRDISQLQLAEAIGVNRSSLNRFISGATDALSHEYVIKIARYFQTSTDFLLGETDDPGRINYDIGELGLTVRAAENLYTRKVDPEILCKILEHDRCGELMQRIGIYVNETLSSGIAAQNQLYSSVGNLLMGHAEAVPADRAAAESTAKFIQAMKQSPSSPERDGIRMNLDSILSDMKKDGPANAKKAAMATKNVVNNMALSMKKGLKGLNLRKVTPEVLVNSILGQLDMSGAPEDLKPEMERVLACLREDLTAYIAILQASKERLQ